METVPIPILELVIAEAVTTLGGREFLKIHCAKVCAACPVFRECVFSCPAIKETFYKSIKDTGDQLHDGLSALFALSDTRAYRYAHPLYGLPDRSIRHRCQTLLGTRLSRGPRRDPRVDDAFKEWGQDRLTRLNTQCTPTHDPGASGNEQHGAESLHLALTRTVALREMRSAAFNLAQSLADCEASTSPSTHGELFYIQGECSQYCYDMQRLGALCLTFVGLITLAAKTDLESFGIPWTAAVLPIISLPILCAGTLARMLQQIVKHRKLVHTIQHLYGYRGPTPIICRYCDTANFSIWLPWALSAVICPLMVSVQVDLDLNAYKAWQISCGAPTGVMLGVLVHCLLRLQEHRTVPKISHWEECAAESGNTRWGLNMFRMNSNFGANLLVCIWFYSGFVLVAMLHDGVVPRTRLGSSLACLPLWGLAAVWFVVLSMRLHRIVKHSIQKCETTAPRVCIVVTAAACGLIGTVGFVVLVDALQWNLCGHRDQQILPLIGIPLQVPNLIVVIPLALLLLKSIVLEARYLYADWTAENDPDNFV